MNILKIILLVLAGLIVLLLIVALFSPKEYTIEREITINKPKQVVFDYVKMAKNQSHYNKWWMADPNIKLDFRGTDGTVGFIAAWESQDDHVGKGEQEIVKIVDGQEVDHTVRFVKPFEGNADTQMIVEAISDNQTKVKWSFHSGMKYPMNVMLVIFPVKKMLEDDLQTSLATLKASLEKQ